MADVEDKEGHGQGGPGGAGTKQQGSTGAGILHDRDVVLFVWSLLVGAWRSKGEAEGFLRGVRWRKGGVGIDGDGGGAWGAAPLLRWC